jgi:hypothetical protein
MLSCLKVTIFGVATLHCTDSVNKLVTHDKHMTLHDSTDAILSRCMASEQSWRNSTYHPHDPFSFKPSLVLVGQVCDVIASKTLLTPKVLGVFFIKTASKQP